MNRQGTASNKGVIRDPLIEFLRFIFCLIIVNYHFYSRYSFLLGIPVFCRGFIGDEFFFIVSGFFFAKAATNNDSDPVAWSCRYFGSRIKKIAIVYYITWLFCFIGHQITVFVESGKTDVLRDFANSIYELLFIEMAGFNKGLYSNAVGWFFSAYLIVIFMIGPFLAKFKKQYVFYAAPLIMFFSYGALSLTFNYLLLPQSVFPNTVILKGLVRALAGINAGVFAYGISGLLKKYCHAYTKLFRAIGICMCSAVILYTVLPSDTAYTDQSVQYDYIFTFILIAGLIMLFTDSLLGEPNKNARVGCFSSIATKFGKYTFYAYFAQAIFYSFDSIIYSSSLPFLGKWLILNVAVVVFTMLLMSLEKTVKALFSKAV